MSYEYQDKIIDDTTRAIRGGCKAPLIVCPCGGGKTRTAARLAHTAVSRGRRVLWVAHTTELVQQAQAVLTGVDVCTIQSKPTGSYDLVIVDECHHFSNNQFSGRVRDIPYRIGLTATPQRADGSPMGDLFDTIVTGPSIKTLTDSGILVPAEVIRPEKYIKGLAMDPIAAYDKHCAGRKAIIYTASVKHATDLAARDPRIVAVYGSMPAQARRRAFQSHKSGEVPILVNCLIATEGYDDPSVSAIIIARSVGSLSLYLQIIGRGIRRSEGKTDCLVVDLRGVSHMHGDYMQDLEFSLDGEGIKRAGGASGLCPICSSVLVSGVCGGCGREPDEMELPKVLNLKLDKFAHKRAQPEAVKISDLAYYMVQARVRGYSMYWALKKFEGIHKHPPPQEWIRKAKQRIGK